MKHLSNPALLLGLPLIVAGCQTKNAEEKPKPEAKRPNIIFIMSDDHAYQAISAYGSTLNQTPNIDRLAKEGMIFTNATVTNSISAPSRAVILTGKFSHLNGKIDNRLPFDSTQMTFPVLMQQGGYQTAMVGKWHLHTLPVGFDFWSILPDQGSYYNPEFITPKGQVKKSGYVSDLITDYVLSFLDTRDTTKPFMIMYHHKAPHREWQPALRHLKEYTQRTYPVPASLFDDYAGRGTAAKTAEMNILHHMTFCGDNKLKPEVFDRLGLKEINKHDKKAYINYSSRFNAQQLEAWNEIYDSLAADFMMRYPDMDEKALMEWKYQRYMQDYLACVAGVDENIGRLLDYLDAKGLSENTIVVYTSDQGFYLGEHGWFDKRFMYRESFRTPLLVRWPAVITPGAKCEELVQNLDFAPTFLDAAGIKVPQEMQGMSLMPILKGESINWRDAVYYHYYEYPAVHMVKRHYGIATKKHKLIHFYHDVDQWELYDLEKDPDEMKNVYDDPQYAPIVKELKEKLEQLRAKYGDSDELAQKFITESQPE